MGGVFINYRIVDQSFGAAAIDHELERRFGRDQVFRDCVSMHPGDDYPTSLREALERVDVLVVVIGPRWLALVDKETGERLINRESDWVRREIRRALQRGIGVVPVLLKDAGEDVQPPRREELPDDIVALANKQVAEVSQRRFREDLDKLTARLLQLVPTLGSTELFAAPPEPPGHNTAPSTLLWPEYEVVPFIGRTAELADLRSWATGPAAYATRLVTGPAGSGRTRLAQQLCGALAGEDWLAGMVSERAPAVAIRNTGRIDRPLLAVVDEAEMRTEQLIALAAALADRPADQAAPARLLLLGDSDGDWLDQLRNHHDERIAAVFQMITKRTTIALAGPPDRYGQFSAARATFARRLGLAELPAGSPNDFDRCESGTDIHAAALVGVLTGGVASSQPPLDRLLNIDRRHLRRLALADGRGGMKTVNLAVAGTLVTLCRPVSEDESQALIARLPYFIADDGYEAEEYARWLRRLYPGPHSLNPIRPTVLGEQLVAGTLAAQPSIPVTLAATCTDEQISNALTVLGRALPRHPGLASAIIDLVRVAPDRLIPIGIDVAARLREPKPFSRALGAAIDDDALTMTSVLSLMDRLARSSDRGLDPLRAAVMRTYTTVFAKPVAEETRRQTGGTDLPAMKPLMQAIDNLTELAQDAVAGILDPDSGRFPKGPDGRPIVSPVMLRMLREVLHLKAQEERRNRDRNSQDD